MTPGQENIVGKVDHYLIRHGYRPTDSIAMERFWRFAKKARCTNKKAALVLMRCAREVVAHGRH